MHLRNQRPGVAAFFLSMLVLAAGSTSHAQEEPNFTINGYIQNQTGLFVSKDRNEVDDEGFPIDHGGKDGRLSMFRNTLQLEMDYRPEENILVRGIFRGVRSAMLDADKFAQVPEFRADATYNYDPEVMAAKKRWGASRYYQENELRELYLDIQATESLNFRIGRQQVTWGETGNYRLLDVINPIDSTWHLSAFENFEDIRIPLWILKALYDVPALDGSMEFVWVPALDKGEDMVTVPLTFVGAWGLPLAPENDYASDLVLDRKIFLYPERDLMDSRVGLRWKGMLGNMSYTLVYFYTHILTPPLPLYVEQWKATDLSDNKHHADVFLDFPRQHVAGFSLDYTLNYPVGTVIRVEASIEPKRKYPVSSSMSAGMAPDGGKGWYDSPSDPLKMRAEFYRAEKTTINYAIVLQRPTLIRFLNPTQSIIVQAQLFQSIIPDGAYLKDPSINAENPSWYLVGIPAYDCSKLSKVQTTLVLAMLTNYLHGMLNPMIVGAYDVGSFSGFVSAQMGFTLGNNWRLAAGINEIFAKEPYKGLGLFRDRDEVFLKAKCQF